jgi:hypothetical protein
LIASSVLAAASAGPAAASVATTIEIVSPAGPYRLFEPIQLQALVQPAPDEPGLVTLSRDGFAVASSPATTDTNGAANFSLPGGLAVGTYTFVATFTGTANSTPSTSLPFVLTVIDDRLPVTVTIASGQNPSLRNDRVSFTVTVSPVPTAGTITIDDGGQGAQKPLDPSGVTVVDMFFHDVGSFPVRALYSGDSTFRPTFSAVDIQQQVTAFDTVTTLAIEPRSLYRDEPLVIHASVSPAPDVPSSVLVRRVGGSPLWTVPLDPLTGLGVLEVPGSEVASRLNPDANVLEGLFGGSDHMNPSSSASVTIVTRHDPTVTVVSGPSTVAPGDIVTATAKVDPAPPEGTFLRFQIIAPNGDRTSGDGLTDAFGQATATIPTVSSWRLGTYQLIARFEGTVRLDLSAGTTTLSLVDTIAPSFGFVLPGPDLTTSTRDIVVPSGADGTGSHVVLAELSNDGATWVAMPYAPLLPWTLSPGDGLKTVWLRVTDEGGNVSFAAYYTILLDTTMPTGVVLIDGGSAATSSRSVTVAAGAEDLGSPLTTLALSNDGSTWTSMDFAPSVPWTLSAGTGTRTVQAKWRDVAGNWSAVKSDSIILDSVAPTGEVSIAGGAINTKTTNVTLRVAATDVGSGLSQVQLSNDGSTWSTRAYAASLNWALLPTNGTRTVYARWKDIAGNWSAVKSDTIALDSVAPTVTLPRHGFVTASAIVSGRITMRMPWSGSDATSGVARYELNQQTDGGAWAIVSTTLTSPTMDRAVAPRHAYRFRVRAIDQAGNIGPWVLGPSFALSRYSETSTRITYGGRWRTVRDSRYWGGIARTSSTARANASITFTGRSIAWIASTAPNRGKAKVYVDGRLVATVDLHSATYQKQRVIWSGAWLTSKSRHVTIRVLGTRGHPRIDLDEFVAAD